MTKKRSRFSDEQIIAMIKEQEVGTATAQVCRKYRISSASFYKYKAKFDGMDVSDERRFRVLAVVDDFARECLALLPNTSLPGLRLARELDNLISHLGKL